MGDRHDRAERHRLPWRAARPDEIGRHHRLPVPGRERVHGAPAERREQQQHEHALAGRRVAEHLREALVGARRAGPGDRAATVGGRERPGARLHGEAGLARVGRAAEQVARIAPQPVGRVPGGHAGAHRGAAARLGDDRLPPDPPGERAVADGDVPRIAHRRGERDLDARGVEPALAGGVRQRGPPGGRERDVAPVDRQDQAPPHLGLLAGQQLGVGHAARLERRDLGLVEHVAQLDAVGRHRDRGEVVDREVAERMGLRRRGQRARQCEQGHDEDGSAHAGSWQSVDGY